jgi:hypothetical protein
VVHRLAERFPEAATVGVHAACEISAAAFPTEH